MSLCVTKVWSSNDVVNVDDAVNKSDDCTDLLSGTTDTDVRNVATSTLITEQQNGKSLDVCRALAQRGRAGYYFRGGILYRRDRILGQEEFHFSIKHRPGTRHENADAMSRRSCPKKDCASNLLHRFSEGQPIDPPVIQHQTVMMKYHAIRYTVGQRKQRVVRVKMEDQCVTPTDQRFLAGTPIAAGLEFSVVIVCGGQPCCQIWKHSAKRMSRMQNSQSFSLIALRRHMSVMLQQPQSKLSPTLFRTQSHLTRMNHHRPLRSK